VKSLDVSGSRNFMNFSSSEHPTLERINIDQTHPSLGRLSRLRSARGTDWKEPAEPGPIRDRLANLAKNPRLDHLSARLSGVDGELAARFADMKLRSLVLAANPLTSKGVKAVATNRTIEKLDIRHTLAKGEECVDALIEMEKEGR
jgi:hypothetical protein